LLPRVKCARLSTSWMVQFPLLTAVPLSAFWHVGRSQNGYLLRLKSQTASSAISSIAIDLPAVLTEVEGDPALLSTFSIQFAAPDSSVCHIQHLKHKKYLCSATPRTVGFSSAKNESSSWLVTLAEPDESTPRFCCPSCKQEGFTEDTLWYHWPRAHGRENAFYVCPICVSPEPQGSAPWGFSSHMFHEHGPEPRRPESGGIVDSTMHCFALVICRHPITKKFLLVEEGCSVGFWIPAGRVDPGETFQQAAKRECLEEAGIAIDLKGILRIEHSPFRNGGGRMRVVVRFKFHPQFRGRTDHPLQFYAEPKDRDAVLKSSPDYESYGAEWISWKKFEKAALSGKKKLRGSEPLEWFDYVHRGCRILPLDAIASEGAAIAFTS
jgi:8-oxo-dGTP pyrophosphatase MutT (NUDIX family)